MYPTLSRISAILALVVFSLSASAQIRFQTSYGNLDSIDVGYSVLPNASGGYFVAGHHSHGQINPYWSVEPTLTMLSEAGDIEWINNYPSDYEHTEFRKILELADGNLLICGVASDFGSTDQSQAILTKMSTAGDIIWSKQYGNISSDAFFDVLETPTGDIMATGRSAAFAAYAQPMVMKVNSSGVHQWDRVLNTTASGESWDIEATQDGNYITLSTVFEFGINKRYWVLTKYSPTGTTLWQKHYGGSDNDFSYALKATADGGYLMGGNTYSFGATTSAMLVKTDAIGVVEWSRIYSGGYIASIRDLVENPDGTFTVAGFAGFTAPGHSSQSVMVMKVAADGAMIWDEHYGGSGYDAILGMARKSNGDYALTGFTRNYHADNNDNKLVMITDGNGISDCHRLDTAMVQDTAVLTIGTLSHTNSNGLAESTFTFTKDNKTLATFEQCGTCTSLTATITASNATCGLANGSATVTASGGVGAYTYTWSSGSTQSSIVNLAPATYTVTITDNVGCQHIDSTTISIDGWTSLSTSSNNASCSANDGDITLTVNNPTSAPSYIWSTGATTASITGLAGGSYTVTVSNATCNEAVTVAITQAAGPTVSTYTKPEHCSDAGGYIWLTVSGGTTPYTYNWSSGGGLGALLNNLTAGTYTATVSDANACSVVRTMQVANFDTCNFNPFQLVYSDTNFWDWPHTIVPAAGGGYYVGSAAYENGNSTNSNRSISKVSANGTLEWMRSLPASNANSNATLVRTNAAGNAIMVTTEDGQGDYNIGISSWDASGNMMWSTGIGGSGSEGCQSFEIAQNGDFLLAGTSNSFQPGPSLGLLNRTDGTGTHLWSTGFSYNGTLLISDAQELPNGNIAVCGHGTPTGATTYDMVVALFDASGNNLWIKSVGTAGTDEFARTMVATADNGLLVAGYQGPSAGARDVLVVRMDGAGNVDWAKSYHSGNAEFPNRVVAAPDGGWLLINSVSFGPAGADMNLMKLDDQGNVDWNDAVEGSGSESGDDVCYNADGDIAILGGTNSWKPAGHSGFERDLLVAVISAVNPIDCHSSGLTWVATTEPCTATTQTATEVSGFANTTFAPIVTPIIAEIDTLICGTQPACTPPTLSITTSPDQCDITSGHATANASGGQTPYTYAWNNGQSTATAIPLAAGLYTVTVTDGTGCTAIDSATVIHIGLDSASLASTNVACFGGSDGSATVSIHGSSAPYTYAWSTGATTQSISNLVPGTYTATASDAAGCIVQKQATITSPTAVNASLTSTQTTCGGNDGTATATATGGTPPYTYAWSNGQSTATAVGLATGTYTVTVQDASSCQSTSSLTVTANNTGVPLTQLAPADCGITLTDMYQYIHANYVPNVERYQYEISDGAGFTYEIWSLPWAPSSNFFSMVWVPGIKYNTTYNVRVKVKVGGCYGDYGPVCTVTTPGGIPATQLAPAYCNGTLSTFNSYFYIEQVPGAERYQFEFSDGAGFTASPFSLSAYPTATWYSMAFVPGASYGTTYTVRVRTRVGGVWGTFGPACTLTTPILPTPTIRAQYCGTTLPTFGNYFHVNTFPGAQRYQYHADDGAGFVGSGFSHSSAPSATWFSFLMMPGIQPGTTYDVSARAKVGGVWGTFGPTCQISTPPATAKAGGLNSTLVAAAPFDVLVFPNPARNSTRLVITGLENGTTASIQVLDMTGRIMHQQQAAIDNSAGIELTGLEEWSSGMYIIRVVCNDAIGWQRLVVE